jgi:HTH-type transcriptional regulator, cell division transcriptional repressor
MLIFMKPGRPSDKPRTAFGQRLTKAREQAGLTQQQLAEKLGTSQRALARWERDPIALRPDQLTVLASILGVSLDYLAGIPDAPEPAPKGPPGKLRRAFEKVRKLSRSRQNRIVEMIETYVDSFSSKES